jgi:Zn-dependent M28 family amino/carboxypeptidase
VEADAESAATKGDAERDDEPQAQRQFPLVSGGSGFGGEELGLLGSQFYVDNLSKPELNKIGYDLDADVTATPNYLIGVLDPAGPDLFGRTVTNTFPNRVYKAAALARDQASTTCTRSAKTTSSCRRREPTRSASTTSVSRPAAC